MPEGSLSSLGSHVCVCIHPRKKEEEELSCVQLEAQKLVPLFYTGGSMDKERKRKICWWGCCRTLGWARRGNATLGSIFFPSSSWGAEASTLSTEAASANVTNPNPLKRVMSYYNQLPFSRGKHVTDTTTHRLWCNWPSPITIIHPRHTDTQVKVTIHNKDR